MEIGGKTTLLREEMKFYCNAEMSSGYNQERKEEAHFYRLLLPA
jgi:hypothetical protein